MKNPNRDRRTTNIEMVCHLDAGAQVVDGDACEDAVCVLSIKIYFFKEYVSESPKHRFAEDKRLQKKKIFHHQAAYFKDKSHVQKSGRPWCH